MPAGPTLRSHPKVPYWLKGEASQNFGDFLSDFFLDRAFLGPRIEADAYHLVGSVLGTGHVAMTIRDFDAKGKIAYWGCGLREPLALSPEMRKRCIFSAVRGPLTRRLLGLGPRTPTADSAFVLPAIYRPSRQADTVGQAICMPHLQDPEDRAALARRTGADRIVEATVPPTRQGLLEIIDRIASAAFVLTGSLHGAIVACAYDVPFAFMDRGHLDIPFKWRDFAASVDIPALFVRTTGEGREAYARLLAPSLKKPKIMPLLKAAPFTVRAPVMARAEAYDRALAMRPPRPSSPPGTSSRHRRRS